MTALALVGLRDGLATFLELYAGSFGAGRMVPPRTCLVMLVKSRYSEIEYNDRGVPPKDGLQAEFEFTQL